MEADAALGRSRSGVVLDAMPGKDLDRTVVHLDRETYRQLPLTDAEDAAHRVLEPHHIRGAIELLDGNVERGRVRGGQLAVWSDDRRLQPWRYLPPSAA